MDPQTFRKADTFIDKIADQLDMVLESEELAELRSALHKMVLALGPRYTVSMNCIVDVFDREREQSIPLLTTGLSTSQENPPYRIWGDSTPHRYLIDGEIQVVPHDRCPRCWEEWDFKFIHRSCAHCGTKLGRDCKILLDSDLCPSCERGKVSMSQPTCRECGQSVDPKIVAWG